MATFAKAPKDVLDRASALLKQHYPHLLDLKLRIDFLFAHAPLDKDEQPKGPALKVHGCPAHAKVRIVSLKDRVLLVLDGNSNMIKVDDIGRPKLRLRPHSYEFGWFTKIAERHGVYSVEVEQARMIQRQAGKTYFQPELFTAPVDPSETSEEPAEVANA